MEVAVQSYGGMFKTGTNPLCTDGEVPTWADVLVCVDSIQCATKDVQEKAPREAIRAASNQLKDKLVQLQSFVDDHLPPVQTMGWNPSISSTDLPAARRRFSFQLEHKVQDMATRLDKKCEECKELQKMNESLKTEMWGLTKKEKPQEAIEMTEVQQTLKSFKTALEGAASLSEADACSLYATVESQCLTLLQPLNQRILDLTTANRRRTLLMAASEKETTDLKVKVEQLHAELLASLRLQEGLEKTSKLPRLSDAETRSQLQRQVDELEQEVEHWQNETEETRTALSDQMSENAALRKQLSTAEDNQQKLNVQLNQESELPIMELKDQLARAQATIAELTHKVLHGNAARADLQEGLEELRAELGNTEFEKLQQEVEEELELEADMDGKLPHEWLEAKANAGHLEHEDIGRLSRKMALMIKRAATPSNQEEEEDAEAVITEFVEQACKWQLEVQRLSQELEEQQAQPSDLDMGFSLGSFALDGEELHRRPSIGSSHDSAMKAAKLEIEVAQLRSQLAGMEALATERANSTATQISAMQEELDLAAMDLERSERRVIELENDLDLMKGSSVRSWVMGRDTLIGEDIYHTPQAAISRLSSDTCPATPSKSDRVAEAARNLLSPITDQDITSGESVWRRWLSQRLESDHGSESSGSTDTLSAGSFSGPGSPPSVAMSLLERFNQGPGFSKTANSRS